MKPSMTRNKTQVYSVGNYLMTGKVLGKGHFARVEEATHRIIGKKVAIKIIDLTCIKEEYARRNLHREPRIMSKLRHPCIAALYETMMHGPRLYVVMEAAGGGDLCAHVLASRGPSRGLPEPRAKALAAQLVSAVRHMHAQGVVHRDLKMENIMLDSSKQFIKIVDFGLSNTWCTGGSLRTPCGSLEYAAPELFVDGRRYGPEVDLWSIGVIVYGMVTGGLPFSGADKGEARSRPQLRAAIAKGFARKQRVALATVSGDCKEFIQQLLEPNVPERMKIEDAARHRWIKRPGLTMRAHPLSHVDPKASRDLHKQISELCGQTLIDVVAQIKAEPFGAMAGIYNIKIHLQQLRNMQATDLLWSSTQEPRPYSPPEYKSLQQIDKEPVASCSQSSQTLPLPAKPNGARKVSPPPKIPEPIPNRVVNGMAIPKTVCTPQNEPSKLQKPELKPDLNRIRSQLNPFFTSANRPLTNPYGGKKPIFRVYDNGDCVDPRLPSIDEHSTDINRKKIVKTQCVKKVSLEDRTIRLNSCPTKILDTKRLEFYRKAGDGVPNWRASGPPTAPARILLQNNATTIKRASLGNIVSPHSSSNSQCKSDRALPVGWCSRAPREPPHLQRFRRTAPMK